MTASFRGKGGPFLRNICLYLLLAGPPVSFCLMGAAWLHAFAGMMALAAFVVPPVAYVIARSDGFSFDDGQQAFVRTFGREIPYASVQRIDLRETSGLLRVTLKRRGWRSVSLVSTLSLNDKPALVAELTRRLPAVELRERRNDDWKALGLIVAAVCLLTTACHLYLVATHPALGARPEMRDWTAELPGGGEHQQEFRTGAFVAVPPAQFHFLGREGDVLFFEDHDRTELRFAATLKAPLREIKWNLLRLMTGMRNFESVLETSCRARFGIIPLLVKDLALSGMEHIRIFQVAGPGSRAVVLQGVRKQREVTTILLGTASGSGEIACLTNGFARMDEGTLQMLIRGVSYRPE